MSTMFYGGPMNWTPVNKTLADWEKEAGGYVIHSGTLLLTKDGIWFCGMIGAVLVPMSEEVLDRYDLKNPETGLQLAIFSSMNQPPDAPERFSGNDIVLAFSDTELPPGAPSACYRKENGLVVCSCGDDY